MIKKFILAICIVFTMAIYSQTDILPNQTYQASVTVGELVYFTGTEWDETDATTEAATCSTLVGIALGNGQILIHGIYRTSGLTVGNYYISTTAGQYTNTAPSATNQVVRLIGYALDSKKLFFNPDATWIVVP